MIESIHSNTEIVKPGFLTSFEHRILETAFVWLHAFGTCYLSIFKVIFLKWLNHAKGPYNSSLTSATNLKI